MPDADVFIKFPCLEVTQPIGNFYVGTMDSRDVVQISAADVRRIVDREVEALVGIQRPLDQSRVSELAQYVNTVDASFPTSIILAIGSDNVEYNPQTKVMKIKRAENVAKMIDGKDCLDG